MQVEYRVEGRDMEPHSELLLTVCLVWVQLTILLVEDFKTHVLHMIKKFNVFFFQRVDISYVSLGYA